jgi:transcriptional regulator with XRE-family HTH domain
MNLTQIHDRLCLELLRRIQRGTLSVSLLARQTGMGQSHLSNFLRGRRRLSLAAMDRILAAQHMSVADLLPAVAYGEAAPAAHESGMVPLVSHAAALFEPNIRPTAVQSMVRFPSSLLASMRTRAPSSRRAWQRFVAVRIPAAEALPMDPLVLPEAIALIDRHYNSLAPYRSSYPNLYAVRQGPHLRLRYVDMELNRLVLRPLSIAFPVELIDLDPSNSPNDLLAGRVALMLNQL